MQVCDLQEALESERKENFLKQRELEAEAECITRLQEENYALNTQLSLVRARQNASGPSQGHQGNGSGANSPTITSFSGGKRGSMIKMDGCVHMLPGSQPSPHGHALVRFSLSVSSTFDGRGGKSCST